jgi:predicted nucleic acid-binding protein
MVLFDTSAVLAHFREEPGWELLEQHLMAREAWVAAGTWLEVAIVMEREGVGPKPLAFYRLSFAGTVDISIEVVDAALAIRHAAPKRVPAMDSLIAGAAKVRGFRLIHRDKHLAQIPQEVLAQTMLPPLLP